MPTTPRRAQVWGLVAAIAGSLILFLRGRSAELDCLRGRPSDASRQEYRTGVLRAGDPEAAREGFAAYQLERRTTLGRWRLEDSAAVQGTLETDEGVYELYALLPVERVAAHEERLSEDRRIWGVRNGAGATVVGTVIAGEPPHFIGRVYEGSPAAVEAALAAYVVRMRLLGGGVLAAGCVALIIGSILVRRRARAGDAPPRLDERRMP